MNRVRGDAIDPNQASLVVQHGNTPRKWRPLKADVTVVGRLRTCDIELASEQVAPVHCIIARVGDSWLIRDCGSPIGTYVNGQLVHEIVLTHGDEIQLGTFSFTTHFPEGERLAPLPEALPQVEQASPRTRHNLAKLALSLRRRLHETQGRLAEAQNFAIASAPPPAELPNKKLTPLPQTREPESSERQAEAKTDLATEREAISEACACLTARVERAERDLVLRMEETEVEIKKALDLVKQKCEQMLREASAKPEAPPLLQTENVVPNPETAAVENASSTQTEADVQPADEVQRLDKRGRELEAFAAHLKRERLQIREREKELAGERVRLTQLMQTLTQERENRRKDEAGALRMASNLARQSNNPTAAST